YAANRHDLNMVQGFVVARDRYFFIEMGRRLGLGQVAGIFGDSGLDSDFESRMSGMTHVAEQLFANLTDTQKANFEAYAAGVNHYVKLAKAGKVPMPSEVELAAGLLGFKEKGDMLTEWTAKDVCGFAAVLIYQLGYETGDVGRGKAVLGFDKLFAGKAFEKLRRDGAVSDIWGDIVPPNKTTSANGWGLETKDGPPKPPPPQDGASAGIPAGQMGAMPTSLPLPPALLERLTSRFKRLQDRLGRHHPSGFGSNAWAVAGDKTKDGFALMAADGHLSLTIPSYFYQAGLNTSVLGGGDVTQLGLLLPGLPLVVVGTNGHVAWNQTQLFGDITDWYREEVQLDDKGAPKTTKFKGEWKAVSKKTEKFTSLKIKSALFPSKGGEQSWDRFTTFDGRWIADIEGKKVKDSYKPAAGETVINFGGNFIVPSDTDKDGVITAVSFDYTGLDNGNLLLGVDAFGSAKNVEEFRQATRHLVAYSQNLVAADGDGDILYTGYQAVPCRGYLDRNKDGSWKPGADPSQLLDGTKYGGFTVVVGKDGKVDESAGKDDPYKCVVPFDKYPQSISPKRGYVVTANNDIGGATLDNSLSNDPWYVGGPWLSGFRAGRIADELIRMGKGKEADVAAMSKLQADKRSPLGAQYTAFLRKAIADGKKLSDKLKVDKGTMAPWEVRAAGLYNSLTQTVVNSVDARLGEWEQADFQALSGVETFYHTPTGTEGKTAVAAMVFNAWLGRFQNLVFNDEPMPGIWRFSGSTSRARTLKRFVLGIGVDNPEKLVSFNKQTGESVFFDILSTKEVERSTEIALKALQQTLQFLAGPPGKEPGTGGFGTEDTSKWLWGLRHQVKFESTIADFFGTDDSFNFITDQFAITTKKLPLAEKMDAKDPRKNLKWFPRGGDAFVVDAAGGTRTDRWHYGSGPVFRMVIGLKKGEVKGVNILPGGQSDIKESAHFSDQAESWLANKTIPLRFSVSDVVAGASGREVFNPAN
ncbi:MAG: penicillin acylase family protein, partial [Myxococcales bacterium]|nr:penicillin acylase family protein [Myxococcales bacterium]